MTKPHWTIFADGYVGEEVLRILGNRDPDSVAAVVTISECTSAQKKVFKKARLFTWEALKLDRETKQLAGKSEIVLLAWWPYVLKGNLLDLGQKIMLNMHPSLLPHGRGKDPNFWCLVENRPLGVTIHHVDRTVDCGDIAFQKEIGSSWLDTGETIYRRSQQALIELFNEVYAQIAALDVPRIKQDLKAGSFHKRAELDAASFIDLDKSYTGRQLLTLLRARTFLGYPGSWFCEGGETFEVTINIRVK